MGFLQAVYSLGVMAEKRHQNSPLADIMSLLQLPYSLGESEDRRAYAIRIWLKVLDTRVKSLEVLGVSRIDLIEYAAIGATEEEIKERCLYREPTGSNVTWGYSPIYKLGKAKRNPVKELLGEGWQKDKDSRLFKLHKRVLKDYEDTEFFAEGSVQRIMDDLENQIDRLGEYWSDSKRSYLMIFGVDNQGVFQYPGEVPAFVAYTRRKLGVTDTSATNQVQKRKKKPKIFCALCGECSDQLQTLAQIFPFATFDKPSFLPGVKRETSAEYKVFPICRKCYSLLSVGKEETENRFVNYTVIPNISLYVIPEIISDSEDYYRKTAELTKDFLKTGIKHEKRLFENLARHDEGLIYHFLFAEVNQAQLIVHYLIEDVPPSHLKWLHDLWKDSCAVFFRGSLKEKEEKLGLDSAFRQIIAILLSLAGKQEQDKIVMKEKALVVIGALLNGDRVETDDLKTLMVSRLAGLYSDPDWIRPKGKDTLPGRIKVKNMAQMVDFMIRVNGGKE